MSVFHWLRAPHYRYVEGVIFSPRADRPSLRGYLVREEWVRWHFWSERYLNWLTLRAHRVPLLRQVVCQAWCDYAEDRFLRPRQREPLVDLPFEKIRPALRERWLGQIAIREEGRGASVSETSEVDQAQSA